MKRFLIYTNKHKDKDRKTTLRICSYLSQRGQKAFFKSDSGHWQEYREQKTEEDGENLTGAEMEELFVPEKEIPGLPENIDCMLVLGGDGTVLQAARECGDRQIPMIGVNMGTLGYLTEIEPSNLEEALDRLIAGQYEQESRMMLTGTAITESGNRDENWALNDIVISRRGPLQIIKFRVYVNGQFLNDYDADGVIVTTPTGSTGYNLSAGGPLVEPGARLIVLTPICPHSLNQRSIVLSSEDTIEIQIPQGHEGSIQTVEASFDGSYVISLHTGDRIRIRQSERRTNFIRLNQVSFLEVLHQKMAD